MSRNYTPAVTLKIDAKLLKIKIIVDSHSLQQKVICLRLAYFSRWDDTLGVSCDYDLARKAVLACGF